MEEIQDYKIFPPYEVFYIESMLTIARSAMSSQTTLRKTLEEITQEKRVSIDNADAIIDAVQNIINQAASLSRYFWPVSSDKMHKKRGQKLREAFNIQESNPLKNRDVRNFMEHFDEKLDLYVSRGIAGNIHPTYVGARVDNSQPIHHFFRAYYINDWTLKVLDLEIDIHPIICEIIRIFLLLEDFNKTGRLVTPDTK